MSGRYARWAAAILAAGLAAACGDEGVTLPENYNTHKSAGRLTVSPADKMPAPRDRVAGLNGLNGSPVPVVAGDPKLDYWYWGRTDTECHPCTPCKKDGDCRHPEVCRAYASGAACSNDSECAYDESCVSDKCAVYRCHGPDGAHIGMVRVGADSDCGLSLESIFPDPGADIEDPASYDFAALDAHVAAIKALNTADVLWQAAYNPGQHGECLTLPGGEQRGQPLVNDAAGDTLKDVVVHTLRHLNNGPKDWDPAGQAFGVRFVEFMGDPIHNLGYTLDNVATLFPKYRTFAGGIKAWWDDKADGTPTIYVGGMSFLFTDPAELADKSEGDHDWPAVFRLIDHCADPPNPTPPGQTVALDFVSFRTRTATPFAVAEIASEIGTHLAEQAIKHPALAKTQLMVTAIDVDWDDPEIVNSGVAYDQDRKAAFLGAFQAAARIYLQDLWNTHEAGARVPLDVRVSWGLAGRGPRVHAGLSATTSLGTTPIPSEYFGPASDGSGRWEPNPAFMALFPFRQVAGHQRVEVHGGDTVGLAIMASHSKASDKVLHVIIANADVRCPVEGRECTNAWVSYELELSNFVPPTFDKVAYKFAAIDHQSYGLDSFFFSDAGKVETIEGTGNVRFTRQMAVPSVHYLQFDKSP